LQIHIHSDKQSNTTGDKVAPSGAHTPQAQIFTVSQTPPAQRHERRGPQLRGQLAIALAAGPADDGELALAGVADEEVQR